MEFINISIAYFWLLNSRFTTYHWTMVGWLRWPLLSANTKLYAAFLCFWPGCEQTLFLLFSSLLVLFLLCPGVPCYKTDTKSSGSVYRSAETKLARTPETQKFSKFQHQSALCDFCWNCNQTVASGWTQGHKFLIFKVFSSKQQLLKGWKHNPNVHSFWIFILMTKVKGQPSTP